MFKHVLVALDGSRRAEAVFPYVLELAQHTQARVTFVCVDPREAAPSRPVVRGNLAAVAVSQPAAVGSAEYLERLLEKMHHFGLNAQTVLRQGDPVTEILAVVQAIGADTIAITTNARKGVDRLMLGSVAQGVLNGSRCPVLMLRID